MKISAIQTVSVQNKYSKNFSNRRVNHYQNKPEAPAPTFKGGKGAIVGASTGFIGTFLALGVSVITAGFTLPLFAATALMVGGGIAGGVVGDKIGDKLSGDNDKK